MKRLNLFISIIIVSLGNLYADVGWKKESIPPWVIVNPVNPVRDGTGTANDSGTRYLLSDKQVRVTEDSQSQYHHTVYRIVNQSGITASSEITMEFDPSYQTLSIHDVCIYRNGKGQSRLDSASVNILRRAQGIEERMFDNRYTVYIILKDIRVGDVIEYHYTLSGANPVYGKRFADYTYFQWSVPVDRTFYRVIWERVRQPAFRTYNTSIEPEIRNTGTSTEYIWDVQGREPIVWESGAPDWYDPYHAVQLSTSESWSDIVQWGLPLYAIEKKESERIRKITLEKTSRFEGVKEKANVLLRFVQDDIRYMGVEIGLYTHKPNRPSLVLERHYGDCKDKSLLLTAMLRELGVAACPALVHSYRGKILGEKLPSIQAFDHVIVRAEIDGEVFYLDPTLTHQKGLLNDLAPCFYGKVLPILEGTTDLAEIPELDLVEHTVYVDETIDVSQGLASQASYTIKTTYLHNDAAAIRSHFESVGISRMQENFLNYLERLYPGVTPVKQLEFADDAASRGAVFSEEYTIPEAWKFSEKEKRYEFTVHPYQLYSYVEKPDTLRRRMPLKISFPTNVEHSISVRLPGKWPVENENTEIRNDFFEYTGSVVYMDKGGSVQLRYQFKTLKDSVAPDELKLYLADLEKVEKDLMYYFTWSGTSGTVSSGEGDGISSVLYFIGVIGIVAFWIFFKSRNRTHTGV